MPESHLTEWKTSWKDDHLKWPCGFSKAQGETQAIVRDAAGKIVDRTDIERQFDALPNKLLAQVCEF